MSPIIKKILAHRDKDYYNETAYGAVMGACNRFLSFLSDLEKSLSAKAADGEGLEEEIVRFFSKNPIPYDHLKDWPLLKNTAIHFYDFGCRRTAEKYDELEYERQRTEELEKPMNQDELEKELDRYLHGEFQQTAGGNFNNYIQVARHFAKWGVEHLKK